MPQIDDSAEITGQSLIEGDSIIGPGALIENSYLQNVTVEANARIIDSVLISMGEPHTHQCDAAGKYISGGSRVIIGERAEVEGSILHNAAVGADSKIKDSSMDECTIGRDCHFLTVKAVLVTTGKAVSITGPTEFSEAWIGHHAYIRNTGYFEGVFSNEFHVLEFDGELKVREALDLPHVSLYGMNSINSTNSGKIFPQPDNILKGLGPHVKLWHDGILSHEPIMLGPCGWVSGWTKVIGLSIAPHPTGRELAEDGLATYIMPFAAAGYGGEAVQGQMVTGELNNGYSVKTRVPGWVFSYAGDAVIRMVQRLWKRMDNKENADRIVELALRNALALADFMMADKGYTPEKIAGKTRGWAGYLAESKRVLQAHLDSGLWKFENGKPLAWEVEGDQYKPLKPELLTAIVPDAIDNAVTEAMLVGCEQEPLTHTMGITAEELEPTRSETFIAPEADIAEDALIGPGVIITGNSVVESGAALFRTVVDNSTVRSGTRIARAVLKNSTVGSNGKLASVLMTDSTVGDDSEAVCARIVNSSLTDKATIAPFSDLENLKAAKPVILGGRVKDTEIDTTLMSMHMAGTAMGLKALPAAIKAGGESGTLFPVPMLGGGSRILGTVEKPAQVEAAFVGSNAILEAGSFAGFGTFILGRLTGEEGLPPFATSFEAGPAKDQIGAVLTQFANILLTHIAGWSFQANGSEKGALSAQLMVSMIETGMAAVKAEIDRRAAGKDWDPEGQYSRYKSLTLYTDAQLEAGLKTYKENLADGRWEMKWTGEEMLFSGPGTWEIKGGAARWKPA